MAKSPATSSTSSKTRGRPEGAKSIERPLTTFRPAQCPTCQSSRRAPFRDGPVAEESIAVEIEGQVYNREVWRNTECLDCGQQYRVIEYRYEPAKKLAVASGEGQQKEWPVASDQ
jgi:hypothetical protein